MDKDELSALPAEARSYQGTAAGVATRFAASGIDGLVVLVWLLAAYGGYIVVRLVISPRSFEVPDPPVPRRKRVLSPGGGLPDVRVVDRRAHHRQPRDGVAGGLEARRAASGSCSSVARAFLCAVFPIGLLWCALDPKRRSLQDLALRTPVVYSWLPRAPRV